MKYVWTVRDGLKSGPRLNIRERHEGGKIVATYTGFDTWEKLAEKGREVVARLNSGGHI